MFRRLPLPPDIPGQLYLHSMPGRYEPFEEVCQAIRAKEIQRVACLAKLDEIHIKSPQYAAAIVQDRLEWEHDPFSIRDFGVPEDPQAFVQFAQSLADRLRQGENILVHCAGGIGRTGTCAVLILLALGSSLDDALAQVEDARSHPETNAQYRLVAWAAGQI